MYTERDRDNQRDRQLDWQSVSKFVCIRPERQGKHRRKTDKTNMRDRQAKQYGHKRQTRQTGKQRRHTRQQDKTNMRERKAKQYGHKRQTRQTGKQRRHTRQQDKTEPDNNTYKIARQMRQQYRQCSKIDRRSQTLNTERQTDNTDRKGR